MNDLVEWVIAGVLMVGLVIFQLAIYAGIVAVILGAAILTLRYFNILMLGVMV